MPWRIVIDCRRLKDFGVGTYIRNFTRALAGIDPKNHYILVARREGRLQSLAAQIREHGGETLVIVADLAQEGERLRVAQEVRVAYGAIDVLINNAGFGWYGFGTEMPWTLARQMMEINVAAVVHLTLLLLPEMKARNSGHVINVGSIAGSLPSQGVALYSATKSFLDTFTTSLYRELRGTNVHVSVVKPGPVSTEFFDAASTKSSGLRIPVERFSVKPEVVADRIWALLRRPARIVLRIPKKQFRNNTHPNRRRTRTYLYS